MRTVRVRIDSPGRVASNRDPGMVKNVGFSLCCINKNKELYQISTETFCREYIIDYFSSRYSHSTDPYSDFEKIDTNRTRLLFSYPLAKKSSDVTAKKKKWARESAKRALRIIRFFERSAGIKERTSINEVEYINAVNENCGGSMFFITSGPKIWQRSPALISLYALLLRLGRYEELTTFRSYTELRKKLNAIGPEMNKNCNDIQVMLHIMKTLRVIMKNIEKIFTETPKDAFTIHVDSGILVLCEGYSNNHGLASRYKKAVNDFRKRNKKVAGKRR